MDSNNIKTEVNMRLMKMILASLIGGVMSLYGHPAHSAENNHPFSGFWGQDFCNAKYNFGDKPYGGDRVYYEHYKIDDIDLRSSQLKFSRHAAGNFVIISKTNNKVVAENQDGVFTYVLTNKSKSLNVKSETGHVNFTLNRCSTIGEIMTENGRNLASSYVAKFRQMHEEVDRELRQYEEAQIERRQQCYNDCESYYEDCKESRVNPQEYSGQERNQVWRERFSETRQCGVYFRQCSSRC
jgi:hypothetical protein